MKSSEILPFSFLTDVVGNFCYRPVDTMRLHPQQIAKGAVRMGAGFGWLNPLGIGFMQIYSFTTLHPILR